VSADDIRGSDVPGSDVPGSDGSAADGLQVQQAAIRHRLAVALRPRATRAQAGIAVLFMVLGFAFALQVRATDDPDQLSTAREQDLVRILDDLTARNERLSVEASDLLTTRDRLASGTDSGAAALDDARRRAATLGILAGTVAAEGPGIRVTVSDPSGRVDAATMLDAVEELRDAGAEAMQIGSVRVVAQTAFLDARPGSVTVDGTTLSAPYTLLAIGDPRTMSAALRIPGGVVESLRNLGADAVVVERDSLSVTALLPASTPRYAQPSTSP
jgi:uncharacterized protein YlxW (UPF0749 family)